MLNACSEDAPDMSNNTKGTYEERNTGDSPLKNTHSKQQNKQTVGSDQNPHTFSNATVPALSQSGDAAVAADFAARLEAAGLHDEAEEARAWHQRFASETTEPEPKQLEPPLPVVTPSRDSSLQAQGLLGGALKKPRCAECTRPLTETETRLCAKCAARSSSSHLVSSTAGKYIPPSLRDGSSRGSRGSYTNSTLRVSNLDADDDYRAVEADLRCMFGAYGRIQRVSVPVDQWTRAPRGFGFVEFMDSKAAERALNRHEVDPFVLGYMKLQLDVVKDNQDSFGTCDTCKEFESSGARKAYDFSGLKALM